jgi:hypothetical protein
MIDAPADGVLMYIHQQFFKTTCLCRKCLTGSITGRFGDNSSSSSSARNYCDESVHNAFCTILAIVTWFLYCENDNSLGLSLNDVFLSFRFDIMNDIITKDSTFYCSEIYKNSLSKLNYCDLVWQQKALKFARVFRDLPIGPIKKLEGSLKTTIQKKKKTMTADMRMPLTYFFFNEVVINHQIVHELYHYMSTMSKECDC